MSQLIVSCSVNARLKAAGILQSGRTSARIKRLCDLETERYTKMIEWADRFDQFDVNVNEGTGEVEW